MRLKSLLFACTLCIGAVTMMAQEKIEWLTIEQAQEQSKKDGDNAKKYFVDCYTDWCGWCKRMDKLKDKLKMLVKKILEQNT